MVSGRIGRLFRGNGGFSVRIGDVDFDIAECIGKLAGHIALVGADVTNLVRRGRCPQRPAGADAPTGVTLIRPLRGHLPYPFCPFGTFPLDKGNRPPGRGKAKFARTMPSPGGRWHGAAMTDEGNAIEI